MAEEQTPNPPSETTEPDAVAALTARAETAEAAVAEIRASVAGAVTAYRDLARAANPGVPAALIDGDSVAGIAASVEAGRATAAEAVRLAGIAANNGHAPHVPTGALAPAPANLSTLEKIKAGLAAR